MSSKIFDAWLLPADTTMADLFRVGRELYAAVAAQRTRLDVALVRKGAVDLLDDRWLAINSGDPADPGLWPVDAVISAWQQRQQRLPRHSPLRDPHRFTACLFHDEPTGRIVAKLFHEPGRYDTVVAEFATANGWTGFEYFDHTDRPDDIDQREWDARHDLWQRVTAGTGAYLDGLTIGLPEEVGIDLLDMELALDGPQDLTGDARRRVIRLATKLAAAGQVPAREISEAVRVLRRRDLGPWAAKLTHHVDLSCAAGVGAPAHRLTREDLTGLLAEVLPGRYGQPDTPSGV